MFTYNSSFTKDNAAKTQLGFCSYIQPNLPGSWELQRYMLRREPKYGFGFAISCMPSTSSKPQTSDIIISDIIKDGAAAGKLRLNDRIACINGVAINNVNKESAVSLIKDSPDILDLIVERKTIQAEVGSVATVKAVDIHRTGTADPGLVLGCQFFVKKMRHELITNPQIEEGDVIQKINGIDTASLSLVDAQNAVERSKGKLSLEILNRGSNCCINCQRCQSSKLVNNSRSLTTSSRLNQQNEGPYITLPNNSRARVRIVTCAKVSHSDVELAGGNTTGIFVRKITDGSPAQEAGLLVADEIIKIDECPVRGLNREEAMCKLMRFTHHPVQLIVRRCLAEYRQLFSSVSTESGDLFYVRALSDFQPLPDSPYMPFSAGEVFKVTDTLHYGIMGGWFATKLNKYNEETAVGLIPSYHGIRVHLRKEIVRAPFYERVEYEQVQHRRPVVLLGPLAGFLRRKLYADKPDMFHTLPSCADMVMKIPSISKAKHCILDPQSQSLTKQDIIQLDPIVVNMQVDDDKDVLDLITKMTGSPYDNYRTHCELARAEQCTHRHMITCELRIKSGQNWYQQLLDLIYREQRKDRWVRRGLLSNAGDTHNGVDQFFSSLSLEGSLELDPDNDHENDATDWCKYSMKNISQEDDSQHESHDHSTGNVMQRSGNGLLPARSWLPREVRSGHPANRVVKFEKERSKGVGSWRSPQTHKMPDSRNIPLTLAYDANGKVVSSNHHTSSKISRLPIDNHSQSRPRHGLQLILNRTKERGVTGIITADNS